VTLASPARLPEVMPKQWLRARADGNVLMFVDTEFSDGSSPDLVRTLCDDVRQIDTKPMSLRSIFTTLASAKSDGMVQ
jgi:hypothetical protein